MSKIVKTAVASLTLFAAYYGFIELEKEPQVQADIVTGPWIAEECTEKLELECVVDIERTVKACAAAFETEGADIIADIKCAKDLLADKKHCWPCICAEAKKKGWHVIGC